MVTWLLFFLFVGAVMYYGWDAFYSSYQSQAHSGSLWRPILWPWKLTVPIASGLLLLQGIVIYAGAVYKAIAGRQPSWLQSG
jgi:TRAP-type mannitol/chloroaromatic compound transport system permease small subunit